MADLLELERRLQAAENRLAYFETLSKLSGLKNQSNTIANNGTAAVFTATSVGSVFIVNTGGNPAHFMIDGANHFYYEISDPDGVYSVTAGTAGTNIYWSAGNSRYEIENKRGASTGYRLFFIGYSP